MSRFSWFPQSLSESESRWFGSFQDAFDVEGIILSKSVTSSLKIVTLEEKSYYVKIYHLSGRHFRRYLGRSRVRAEWENLIYFRSIGLPTVRLVAFGERATSLGKREGILVTEELANTNDLATLVRNKDPRIKDRQWIEHVMTQVADCVRKLHRESFIHYDLKWRNILVELKDKPQVFFIDCPIGRHQPNWLRERGVIKDLACLDKLGKYHLSKTSRMRFYHRYTQKSKINMRDKYRIRRILNFFDGRE